MNSGFRTFLSIMVITLFVFLGAGYVRAEGPNAEDETSSCFNCHGNKSLKMNFENDEAISVYIDRKRFKTSVHYFLSCAQCHKEFSDENHPARKFATRQAYSERQAFNCRGCHKEKDICKNIVHEGFARTGDQKKAPCTLCHDAHYFGKKPKGIALSSEEKYCMKCHGKERTMMIRNGERVSIKVDMHHLSGSVHNKISCSDCHFGFSFDEHPQRKFNTKRDFVLASSAVCRRCHFDKYTKTMESIHYTMLSMGRTEAPVCTDCHGSHMVPYVVKEKSFIARRCKKCHPEIYGTYVQSVHGNALINDNNQDVPVCTDCHTSHDIQNPYSLDYREHIPEMCSKCHADTRITSKYGLSPEVGDSYISDFHGITLKLYKMQKEIDMDPTKQIAVCTDCHGTHDIASTRNSDASMVKENLMERCRKCHEGAPPNFPASWLSHYEASLVHTPLVYFVKKFFEILIPIMLIGMVVQIILHIWRYAMNR